MNYFSASEGISFVLRSFFELRFFMDLEIYPQLCLPKACPLQKIELLIGDSTKAREKLGWHPKYTFDELIEEMIEQDQLKIKEAWNSDEAYTGVTKI